MSSPVAESTTATTAESIVTKSPSAKSSHSVPQLGVVELTVDQERNGLTEDEPDEGGG